MQEIILKKGKEFPLKRFHPWVFSGALKTQTKGIEEGEKVRILDAKGNFLGIAHFQDGSIALRVISWEDRPIDVSFWKEKIEKALAVRNTFFIPNAEHTNCFRLIHVDYFYSGISKSFLLNDYTLCHFQKTKIVILCF